MTVKTLSLKFTVQDNLQMSYLDISEIFIPVSEWWVKSLSHVRFFLTPWTVAYQAPPSMGFSRQEYWSGLPFPSPSFLWMAIKLMGLFNAPLPVTGCSMAQQVKHRFWSQSLWFGIVALTPTSCMPIGKLFNSSKGQFPHPQNGSKQSTIGLLWWLHDFTNGTQQSEKVKVAQSCPTLCAPMDCSPPGSSVHGGTWQRVPDKL